MLGGQRLDRRLIGWMVPEAMFHIDASQPASWMTVAMSCELVLRWAQQHEDEFDVSILSRNLVCVAQQDLAPLVWLALRLLRIDHCAPQSCTPRRPSARRAAICWTGCSAASCRRHRPRPIARGGRTTS